jgi:hypothetical protein
MQICSLGSAWGQLPLTCAYCCNYPLCAFWETTSWRYEDALNDLVQRSSALASEKCMPWGTIVNDNEKGGCAGAVNCVRPLAHFALLR